MPIGSIRPSGRQIAAPQVSVNADQFGAGIARALNGLAETHLSILNSSENVTDAEQSVGLAHRRRENSLARARARASLYQTRTQLLQDIDQLQQDWDPSGEGFTNAVYDQASQAVAAWEAGIPENLREEFIDQREQLLAEFAQTSYGVERNMQNVAFEYNFGIVQSDLLDQVAQGRITPEDAYQTASEFLSDSPLGTQTTLELLDQGRELFYLSALQQEANEYAANPIAQTGQIGGVHDGSDVAATGLPGYARSVLNGGTGAYTVTPGTSPLIGSLDGASYLTRPTAAQTMDALLDGPYARLSQMIGRQLPITDAIAQAGTSRETETTGSQHFHGTALDVSLAGMNNEEMLQVFQAAVAAGFTGFGFGNGYMHIDAREQPNHWVYGVSSFGGVPVTELRAYLDANAQPTLFRNDLAGVGTVPQNSPYRQGMGEDFDTHPGGSAGRYAIGEDAWARVSEALDLQDMSPASQDRAAWWLAQEHYQNVVGEDSPGLEDILASGDSVLIRAAQGVLAEATEVDLSALADMSPEEFENRVRTTEGTMPDFVYNSRYASLSFAQRQTAFTDAMGARAQQTAAAAQQARVARSNFLDEFEARIRLGETSFAEIEQVSEDYNLSPSERLSMQTVLEDVHGTAIDAANFAGRLANPNSFFTSTDEGSADAYGETAILPALREQDAQTSQALLGPLVNRMGYIPEVVVRELELGLRSNDMQQAEFSHAMLSSIYATDAVAFESAFGEDLYLLAAGQQILTGTMSTAEMIQRMRAPLEDPQYEQRASQYRTLLETARRDNPERWTAANIADRIDGINSETIVAAPQQIALEREYSNLVNYYTTQLMSPQDAQAAAIEVLNQRWGETTATGNGDSNTMRRPPERFYPRLTQEDFNQQVLRDTGLPAGSNYVLVSDHITEREISQGELPGYQVWAADENGFFIPIMQTSVPTGAVLNSRYPLRLRFNAAPAEARALETAVTQQRLSMTEYELARVERDIAELDVLQVSPERMDQQSYTEIMAELTARQEQLQTQLTEQREASRTPFPDLTDTDWYREQLEQDEAQQERLQTTLATASDMAGSVVGSIQTWFRESPERQASVDRASAVYRAEEASGAGEDANPRVRELFIENIQQELPDLSRDEAEVLWFISRISIEEDVNFQRAQELFLERGEE